MEGSTTVAARLGRGQIWLRRIIGVPQRGERHICGRDGSGDEKEEAELIGGRCLGSGALRRGQGEAAEWKGRRSTRQLIGKREGGRERDGL